MNFGTSARDRGWSAREHNPLKSEKICRFTDSRQHARVAIICRCNRKQWPSPRRVTCRHLQKRHPL